MKRHSARFWEIDFLRGLAVAAMVVYHAFYDVRYMGVSTVAMPHDFWFIVPRAIDFVFLFVVGVSLTLSCSRSVVCGNKKSFGKYLRRGAWIFALGLIITAVTWLFLGEGYVVFGALHMIGASIVLAYPFLRYKKRNLALGTLIIAAGVVLQHMRFDFPYLLWLGFIPRDFSSVDYLPLLPWFGVVLLGIYAGNTLYTGYERRAAIPEAPKGPMRRAFSYLGQKALPVYLAHQPIIIGFLYLFYGVELF